MKKALIVIDMQNDYFCSGKMELIGINDVLEKTNRLIAFARKEKYQIYFIQHFATKENASFFIPNTNGVKLNKNLDMQNDTIIVKNYPNSFRNTNLKEELDKKGINDLIMCGAMTHMCIDTTVRAGFDLGYNIILASDVCATRDLSFKDKVIKAKDVQSAFLGSLDGIFCTVKKVSEIVLCQVKSSFVQIKCVNPPIPKITLYIFP